MLETLLELVDVPLPEGVVAEELQGRREQITQQLAYAGMTHEQYLENEDQTAEEFEADLDRRVRDAITAQFVLDEIATKEQMGVSEAELTEHLVRRAQQSGVSPDEYAKHVMEHDHISSLVSEVVRAKALAHVVETRDRHRRVRQRGRPGPAAARRHFRRRALPTDPVTKVGASCRHD